MELNKADADRIHKYISYECHGRANLHEIEQKFPNVNNLKSGLLKSSSFWVAQLSDNKWEIRPKVNVKLCACYSLDSCNSQCMKLHLCRDFLVSAKCCKSPCEKQFSHNVQSLHNASILSKVFPRSYTNGGFNISILRSSFPRLCQEFVRKGQCNSVFCGCLHICPNHIKGKCSGNCKQAALSRKPKSHVHDFSRDHNKKVLLMFSLFGGGRLDLQEVRANILFPTDSSITNESLATESKTFASGHSMSNLAHATGANGPEIPFSGNNHGAQPMVRSSCSVSVSSSMSDVSVNNMDPDERCDYSNCGKPALVSEADLLQKFYSLRLCFFYLNGACSMKSCPRLHFCKEFLIDKSKCANSTCMYGFSHDPLDAHNKFIVKANPEVSSQKIMELLRKAFPRVCRNYLNNRGCIDCQCNRLHSCASLFNSTSCKERDCAKSHDLQDEHNQNVLRNFSLNSTIRKQNLDYILANVLFSKSHAILPTPQIDYSIPASSSYGILPTPYAKTPAIAKDDGLVRRLALKVVRRLVSPPNSGSAMFDDTYDQAVVTNFTDFFRIVKDEENKETIYACMKNVKPCFYYWRKGVSCRMENCDMFHVCKKFLFDEKNHAGFCEGNHNFESEHERKLLSQHNLQHFTVEQVKIMLRIRYPQVCKDYLKQACFGEDFCPDVHVCSDFLQGKCNRHPCKFQHEGGLQDEHAKRLMKEFHIKETHFRSCVMLPKRSLGLQLRKSNIEFKEEETREDRLMYFSSSDEDSDEMPSLEDLKTVIIKEQTQLLGRKRSELKPYGHEQGILSSKLAAAKIKNVDHLSKQLEASTHMSDGASSNTGRGKERINNDLKPSASGETIDRSDSGSILRKAVYGSQSNVSFGFPTATVKQLGQSDGNNKRLSLSTLKKESEGWAEPSEIDVFASILKDRATSNEGCVSLCDAEFKIKHFNNSKKKMYLWFEKHASTFRIDRWDLCLGPDFYLCVENIAPCFEYWINNCNKSNCKKFHICKKFLHGIQHSGISCKFNHDFKDTHERQLILSNQLDALSPTELQMLLRIRYPFACQNYLAVGCPFTSYTPCCLECLDGKCGINHNESICSRVHICGEFLEGKCAKPEGLCSYNHNYGLTNDHAVRIMNEYHIETGSDLKKSIIYWRTDEEEKKRKIIILKPNFDWLREEAICYQYLQGECDSCNLYHSDLPYAWQYYRSDAWHMFSTHLNNELEKCYCDSSQEDAFVSSSNGRTTIPDLTIQNNDWTSGTYRGSTVAVRRLSTKSSVLCSGTGVVGLTEWKWYWKNNSRWDEYKKWTSSEEIEKSFLKNNKGSIRFRTDEFQYALSFGSMEQQNMDERYFTKRQVRRRPVYKTKKALSKVTQVIAVNNELPWHWPLNEVSLTGGRIDVEANKKKMIGRQFEASMKYNVRVIDVEEICNAEFYEKYQSKKRSLTAKVGSNSLNELSLYHGTYANVVDGICAQNFDWRLSGKNATMYGQGSYFAKSASYSHNYTDQDLNNCRYMFLAQVLAGKYTVGNSTMKRPPAVNPSVDAHTLYDSCVDTMLNPSIFVIFERDQCYPQYLITYISSSDVSYHTSTARSMHTPRKKPQPLLTPLSNRASSISPASTPRTPPHSHYACANATSSGGQTSLSADQKKNCVIS